MGKGLVFHPSPTREGSSHGVSSSHLLLKKLFTFLFGFLKGTSHPLASSKHELHELASFGKCSVSKSCKSVFLEMLSKETQACKEEGSLGRTDFLQKREGWDSFFPLATWRPISGSPFLWRIPQPSSEKMVSQRQSSNVPKDRYRVTRSVQAFP